MTNKTEPTEKSLQDKILDTVLSRQKENEPVQNPKLKRIIKALFRWLIVAFIVWFFFFKKDHSTNIEGLEEYREMMLQDHLRSQQNEIKLNQLKSEDDERNQKITHDSLAIFNSSRAYRDSLRAIHNPAD